MANRRPYRAVDIGPVENRPTTPLPQTMSQTATERPECIETGFWVHFLESNQDLYPREKITDFYHLLCTLAYAIGDFPDTRLMHDRGQLKNHLWLNIEIGGVVMVYTDMTFLMRQPHWAQPNGHLGPTLA